jgi:radical SAM protein
MSYEDRPFIAIWEVTQACDLVCKHCRACARPNRDSGELTTEEGMRLLDRFADARVPLVVLTGGDPAKRPDLVELVRYGKSRGLRMGLTPSATPLVTGALIDELARAGLDRLAISIDGADATTHDAFRGVPGSFMHALRILSQARAADIGTQINSTLHADNSADLGAMSELVASTGALLWSVFYVVPTGRAEARMLPSPQIVEASLRELARIARAAPFAIKTTAAPHYRRVLLEERRQGAEDIGYGVHGKQSDRVNDGRGFLFVSHLGGVYPSGFLPIDCGNVKGSDPIAIYREHPLFRALRDEDRLSGKCRACAFRRVCGGSRARAFALTGDVHASDPLCAYVPPGYAEPSPRRRLELVP